jgi:hypothetical protein
MKHLRFSFAASAVTASLVLGACSAGSQTSIPALTSPATAVGESPLASSQESAGGKSGTAVIVVHWPKRTAVTRKPRFISPSTQSVVVEVQPVTGGKTVTKIANAPSAASTTLRIEVPVGSDNFFVSAYDRPQRSGKSPVGNELGQAEVTKTIHAGTNNVNFTIDGIVAAVGVALGTPSYMAELSGNPNKQELVLVGDTASTIRLTPLDADGNAIVAPGAVPTVSLQTGLDSSGGLTVTQSQSKPNVYDVTVTAPSSNGSYGLIATAKDGLGNSVASNITVIPSQAFYVGYADGSGSRIGVYDRAGKPLAMPSTAFSGSTAPVGLAYDSDDHRLFVADASGKVFGFDGAGNKIAGFATPSVHGISSIAYFNAYIVGIPSAVIPNPKRIIVGYASGVAEFDAETGAQIVQTALAFTPTSVAGSNDPFNPLISPTGWLVFIGDPSGSIDPYDLPTLAAYPTYNLPTNGQVPTGLGYIERLYANFFGYSLLEDVCVDHNSTYDAQNLAINCLYAVTGSTSHLIRLSNYAGSFGQAGLNGAYNQVTLPGTLSAVTIDPLANQAAIVRSDQNSVEELTIDDSYNHNTQKFSFGLKPTHSFATPASLGFSNPNSIAVEW